MKRITIISSILALHVSLLTSSAAVPLRWTVETSRLQPAVFDVVRGETLELEASFQSYGTPVSTSNMTAIVCWQTNGMGSAWWVTNGVTTANVARVLFTPEMDPGSPTVSAFIGLTQSANPLTTQSVNYRAAFTLRYRHGPGAVPNALDTPPRILDLAHTVVVNPPWPTQADFAATTTVMKAELKTYVDGQITSAGLVSPEMTTNISSAVVSNVVTKSFVEELGIEAGLTEDQVKDLVKSSTLTNGGAKAYADATFRNSSDNVSHVNLFTEWNVTSISVYKVEFEYSGNNQWRIYIYGGYDRIRHYAGDYAGGPDATEITFISGEPDLPEVVRRSKSATSGQPFVTADNVPSTNGFVTASVTNVVAEEVRTKASASDVATLNQGYTRLYNFATGATNANFTATNYPPTAAAAASKVHWAPEDGMDFSDVPASLQLNELRDGAWRTVMDTRDWTVWYYRFKEKTLTNEIENLKAENAALSNRLVNAQAWANHTANGVENPMADTLVVDRPNMWLMADYEWQKCVSGSNSCWVIRAKNVALSGGANTNGFLEICDAFGKPYMRVNKSAETFADCVFSNITYNVSEGAWYIVYGNMTKPKKGGANCDLVGATSGGGRCILYDEEDPDCPATITWPESADSHAGHWIMKAVPKPVNGVVPSKMFFGAEIKVAGKDYVEYIKEASFGAGIRVGNNVYEAVESGNTLIWQKKVD